MKQQYNRGKYVNTKTGWEGFDAFVEMAVDKLAKDFEDKAVEWAEKTCADWQENVPVDTGNLRESITIDDTAMPKSITVGVDEIKLTNNYQGKRLPSIQSFYEKEINEGTWFKPIIKVTKTGYSRKIPKYNYVPGAEKNAKDLRLRYFVERIWFEKAKQNLREMSK